MRPAPASAYGPIVASNDTTSPSAEDDALLGDLTREQRDAVTTRASPLCVIAGAGSGKTRVLTRRIAWQTREAHVDPRRVLALTFTRKAASELRARLRRLGLRDAVSAGTFHAVALAQLRRQAADAGRKPPEILEYRAGLLSRLRPDANRNTISDLANEIGWARARLITPERYGDAAAAAGRRPPQGGAATAEAYADYEAAKRKRRVLDFDDVLATCYSSMISRSDVAAAHRWRHQHLVVDEFQDVNPLQFELLKSWIGDDSTLVVVGDPDQAIYGWNGADPDFINEIQHHIPGCAVLHLRTNFRSTPEILSAAGRVLDRDPQPSRRSPGLDPTVDSCLGNDEPAHLARAVRSRHRPGEPWRHQAVLARTNAQLLPLRKALERHGIPVAATVESDILKRPDIRDLLGSWPNEGSLATAITDARMDAILPSDAEEDEVDEDTAAAFDTLISLADDHLALDADATVRSFTISLRSGDRWSSPRDGVELATFHAAKGLEWPIVHLVGLEDGMVPIAHARTKAARAEEQRLLHVATTRAELELHVMWCSTRTMGKRVVEREPSPWLGAFVGQTDSGSGDSSDAAHGEVIDLTSAAAIDQARRQLADVSTAGTTGPKAEAAATLREALESWRTGIARQSLVEPHAVLSDAALDDLVNRRPASDEQLSLVESIGAGRRQRWGSQILAVIRDSEPSEQLAE